MFCISCGSWIGYKADYCLKCKARMTRRLKKAIKNEEPETIVPGYTREEMRANGRKGLLVRKANSKILCEQLRDSHYTVPEIVKITGFSKTWICKYIFKFLRHKCLKKEGMYFVPKELLEIFEKVELTRQARRQAMRETIRKRTQTGHIRGFSFGLSKLRG